MVYICAQGNFSNSCLYSEFSAGTHAVQNVSVQQIQGEEKVNTTCTFLMDSQALGCQVNLSGAGGARQTINIFRDAGSVNARSTDSLINIPAGMCDVEAYDIDSNGNVSRFLATSTTLEIEYVSVSSTALETTRVFASSTTTSKWCLRSLHVYSIHSYRMNMLQRTSITEMLNRQLKKNFVFCFAYSSQ